MIIVVIDIFGLLIFKFSISGYFPIFIFSFLALNVVSVCSLEKMSILGPSYVPVSYNPLPHPLHIAY